MRSFFCNFCVIFMMIVLSCCSPNLRIHGNILDDEELQSIQAGVHTKEQTEQLLGVPIYRQLWGDKSEGWYYLGEITKQVAFYWPDVENRRVTLIKFDPQGIVQAVETHDEKTMVAIRPSSKVTPTLGRDPSLLKEIFGSVGKYDHAKAQRGGRVSQLDL